MSDYHLHLHPHEPAEGGPPPGEYPPGLIESYVEAAAARGVDELGFTEHLYRCVESEEALGPFWEREPRRDLAEHSEAFVRADRNLSLDAYVEAVVAAKDRGLPVKLGLEVDFFPETIDSVLELLAPYPWDFLIGSVHWVGGWALDSSAVAYEYDRRGVDRAWEDYFEVEVELAASGTVDVLAHVDLPKKYGRRPADEPIELYRKVVEAAKASGTAVEVSSQGLRKPAGEVYPSPVFLAMFAEAGVPITLASDAHTADEAGWGHREVVEAARAAGYTTRLGFDARRRYEVPLPR
ncbi:MAG: histidinol-phosphatase [Acidimicrobiia bacterium]|nr:MAG: histidinol-phosphatase [Acidimicrobiia bacterium]